MSDVWARWEGHVIEGVYPLRRYLGGSDHSGVFLTECTARGIPNAALKLVPVKATLAESQLAHWRTAASVSHAHLMRVLGSGRCKLGEQEFLYFVMEYAEQNLAGLLRHRAMSEDEAREMLLAGLDALAFLHSLNLVQGQFKPANVLVVDDQLKLASDTIRPAGEPNASLAMLSQYDPPEARDGKFSTAGDLWALGMTAFEALTQARVEGSPGIPPNFPPALAEIVRRCTNTNPTSRPRAREVEGWLKYGMPSPGKGGTAPAPNVGSAGEPAKVAPKPQSESSSRPGPVAKGAAAAASAKSSSPTHNAVPANSTVPANRGASPNRAPPAGVGAPASGAAPRGGGAPPGGDVRSSGGARPGSDARPSGGARPGGDARPSGGATSRGGAASSAGAAAASGTAPGAPTKLVIRAVLRPDAPGTATKVRGATKTPPPRTGYSWQSLAIGAGAVVVVGWLGLRMFQGHQSPATTPSPPAAATATNEAAGPNEQAGAAPLTQSVLPSGSAAATGSASASRSTNAPKGSATSSGAEGAKAGVVHEEIPVTSASARATIRGHLKVSVRVTLDRAGNVVGVTLLEPGPSRYFARVAAQAAHKWRFDPAASGAAREHVLRFLFSRDGATAQVVR